MLAFRSEGHVDRWCEADKLSPDWTRATPKQAMDVFSSLGLVGDFWQLQA